MMKRTTGILLLSLFFMSSIQAHEVIFLREGKPLFAITYPETWKQTVEKDRIWAVSEQGDAFSAIAPLEEDVQTMKDGMARVKKGVENYLDDVKYEPEFKPEVIDGLAVRGTGKTKADGKDVIFATGVFESGENQLTGIWFVIDDDLEELYTETIRAICRSIVRENELEAIGIGETKN